MCQHSDKNLKDFTTNVPFSKELLHNLTTDAPPLHHLKQPIHYNKEITTSSKKKLDKNYCLFVSAQKIKVKPGQAYPISFHKCINYFKTESVNGKVVDFRFTSASLYAYIIMSSEFTDEVVRELINRTWSEMKNLAQK